MINNEIVLIPRISEKSFILSTKDHTYMFSVNIGLNKIQIKNSVEAQFGVNVIKVNTVRMIGKNTRSVSKKRANIIGKRNNTKRAYVTINSDQSIPIFATMNKSATDSVETLKGSK